MRKVGAGAPDCAIQDGWMRDTRTAASAIDLSKAFIAGISPQEIRLNPVIGLKKGDN